MRKALIIGINEYFNENDNLPGCVEDASSLASVLQNHANGDPNFSCRLITTSKEATTSNLKTQIQQLFDKSNDTEIALFYFSGHGFVDSTGGYFITNDTKLGNEGISMQWLQDIVNQSTIKNKVIILDCCYAGAQGVMPDNYGLSNNSILSSGTTILSASRQNETSGATNLGSIFTNLVLDALKGGAADILGNITPASIYSYVDKALGPWNQRPVFKTNISKFFSLRNSQPSISKERLRNIIKYFESPFDSFPLNPSFEPTSQNPNKHNVIIFKDLQKYRDVGLITPADAEHMYYAAIESKSCRLTAMGLQYWKLIKENKL